MPTKPNENAGRKRRPAFWRVIRASVVALLSVYVLYLVAINVFLSTSLFQRVLGQDPITLDIHYARAWALFPTRIHATNLSIRSSDSNVEWILRLDDVTFDVSLRSLARKRFVVNFAHGHGISMRARQKLDQRPDEAHGQGWRDLAPVEGFPPYSIRPSGPPHPERWDDSQYHLWTVVLENVIAEDVREVWIEQGRFTGNARVAGRFYLKPIRGVEIGPAHVDIRHGTVSIGHDRTLADEVKGSLDLTAEHFDPRNVSGSTVLRYFTLHSELGVSVPNLRAALPMETKLSIGGALRVPRLAARIERGRLAPGTHVDLFTQGLSVANDEHTGIGEFRIAADVTPMHVLTAKLEGTHLELLRHDRGRVIVAPQITGSVDARELDLASDKPFGDAHFVIDVPSASIDNAKVLNSYLPTSTPITILNGQANAQAHAEFWQHDQHAGGYASLEASNVDARVAKMRTQAAFRMSAGVDSWTKGQMILEGATAHLQASEISISANRTPQNFMARAKDITFDVHSERVDLKDPLRNFDEAKFDIGSANVVDATLIRKHLPNDSKLRSVSLTKKTAFSADGHFKVDNHVAAGEVHARTGNLGLTFGDNESLRPIHASIEAHAKFHHWRWKDGNLAIDRASLTLRNVAMGRTARERRAPAAFVRRIGIGFMSPHFRFSDPFARLFEAQAEMEGVKIDDITAVRAFMPDDAAYALAAHEGTLAAKAHLVVRNHIARGDASFTAHGMGLQTKLVTFLGDADAQIGIREWDVRGSVMSLADSRAAVTDVHGQFQKPNGDEAEPEAGEIFAKKIEFTGNATEFDTASPSLQRVEARLLIQDCDLRDARGLNRLIPGNAISVQSGEARVNADISISAEEHRASGGLKLDISKASVALNQTKLKGDFGININIVGYDADHGSLNISGSNIAMTNIGITNASSTTQGWSAHVQLEEARVAFGDRKGIDAVIHLEAKDAKPVLAVVLRDSLPKFLMGALEAPKLAVRANLHVEPRAVVVSNVYGAGGDIAFRGTYAVLTDKKMVKQVPDSEQRVTTAAKKTGGGAFIVSKSGLAMGLRLDDQGGAHAQFFGLSKWLTQEERNIKTKAETWATKAR